MGSDEVKVTIRLSPQTHQALKVEAAQRRLTIGEVVEEALRTRVTLVRVDAGKAERPREG